MRSKLVAALMVALLTACGGNAVPSAPHAPSVAKAHPPAPGKLTIHIRIPKRHHGKRRARYIASTTQAMTLAIAGPTPVSTQVDGLTPSSPGCTAPYGSTTCTLTIPNLAPCVSGGNCYAVTIFTYDAYSAGDNTIPVGAHALSALRSFGFTIVTGRNNALTFTLEGIPVSAAIVPSQGSSITGSMGGGFSLSRCASKQSVDVVGIDADKNVILGPGQPATSLTTQSSVLAIATPPPTPYSNTYTLSLTSAPSANQQITLTASAIPGAYSTGTKVGTQGTMTFNSDLCGKITEFDIPTKNSVPVGISKGGDGAQWFSEMSGNQIGRITTSGSVVEYPVPTAASAPFDVVEAPDGAVWFTESASSKVAHVATASGYYYNPGAIIENALPANADPQGVAVGPDSAFWMAYNSSSQIGRMRIDLGPYPNPSVVRAHTRVAPAMRSYAKTVRDAGGSIRHLFLRRNSRFARLVNPHTAATNLAYWGLPVQTAPHIYLIFWGFSGPNDTTDDPAGVATYLTNFVTALDGTLWPSTMTQYYQTMGSTTTPIGVVGSEPTGVWYDTTSNPQPQNLPGGLYSAAQFKAEGINAVAHFNSGVPDPDANYIVITPHGTNEDDFASGDWCAYHTYGGGAGTAAMTLLPYLPDDAHCGDGDVTKPGTLDGISIVGGHEIAETITDPQPYGAYAGGAGWMDTGGSEIADKCAWVDLENTPFGNANYPTQPLWSDARNGCVQG
ncbi:MAG: hypothetical protein JO199_02585, partial [Candidatus Eremiobacteraeota bacterium]|nr:hypothetical protein [Candidatus Eremiobacteraeota bacterium]